MIGIVTIRDGNMAQIMKIPVDIGVWRENAGFKHVTKGVDAGRHVQRHSVTVGVHHESRVNGFVDPVSPSLEILKVEAQLVDWPVNVTENTVGRTSWPSSAGHQRIEFWEVTLWDWLSQVVETFQSTQIVAHTLSVESENS